MTNYEMQVLYELSEIKREIANNQTDGEQYAKGFDDGFKQGIKVLAQAITKTVEEYTTHYDVDLEED